MIISSVQSLSRVRLFATPWTAARQASLSIANSQSLLKLMSIESVMPSNHLILCHPLLLLTLIVLFTQHLLSPQSPTWSQRRDKPQPPLGSLAKAGLCPLEEESLVQGLSSRALSSNQTASLTRNAPILPAMPDLLCYAFPINLLSSTDWGPSPRTVSRVHSTLVVKHTFSLLNGVDQGTSSCACAYSLTSVMSDSLQPHGP